LAFGFCRKLKVAAEAILGHELSKNHWRSPAAVLAASQFSQKHKKK
jgi:hypothetical protein